MTTRRKPVLFIAFTAFVVFTALFPAAALAGEDLPRTLLTERGKLIYSEDFTQPLPPFTGKPIGFATGFLGWHYNAGPAPSHGGVWTIADGIFTGTESLDAHHPATASYGIEFKDAIIQCDVRLDDVPDEGRKSRYVQIKLTDVKEYIVVVSLGQGGLTARPCDDAHINPVNHQRMEGTPVRVATPGKLGEWHTVVLEVKGDEAVATLDGKSATFSDPIVGWDKHSIMLVAGTQGSFRHFRVWEALPNPDWAKSKEALTNAGKAEQK
jgi:hypothetical protein